MENVIFLVLYNRPEEFQKNKDYK